MPRPQPFPPPQSDVPARWPPLLAPAAVAGAAAWASSAGTLPGQAARLLGAAAQGLLWGALCAGLGRATAAMLRARGVPLARTAYRRAAPCLLLALASSHLARLVAEAARGPQVWPTFFYLSWVVPPAMAILWCLILTPRTTRAVYRAARESPAAAPLLGLGILVLSAAALVSLGDLAFEWGGSSPVDLRLRRDVVLAHAWVSNVAILSGAYALAFALTARMVAAQLLVSPLYVFLAVGTLAKLRFLHSAVQPLDLLRVPELVPLLPRFFGGAAIVAGLTAASVWLVGLAASGRAPAWRLAPAPRCSLALAGALVLLAFPAAFHLAPSRAAARTFLHYAGAPDVQHREKARSSGPLLTFLSELPAALVTKPPGYSAKAVADALRAHPTSTPASPGVAGSGHVDLVVYLVESLMDPDDLGLRFTGDPIPNIRALARAHSAGYAIVPEAFGGSANTEFELLTGMSMAFLPRGSLPFRQYLRNPVPSLPRALADQGYATVAVQADARYYYNRERVYELLGFRQVVWLNEAPAVERAPRPGWPSDRAVVGAVVEASRGRHPFFAFAFPSSTHSPYTSGVYRGSDLDVIEPAPGDSVGEVKEYINALCEADRAVGMLIEHFRRAPHPTIIAVLGDHLAPLSRDALGPFFQRRPGLSRPAWARLTRRVPIVVWANFPLPRHTLELGVSALPSYLLEAVGAPMPAFLGVTADVRRRVPVLSSYVQNAEGRMWEWDSVPAAERALLRDYRLLQYDLLLGGRHAMARGGR